MSTVNTPTIQLKKIFRALLFGAVFSPLSAFAMPRGGLSENCDDLLSGSEMAVQRLSQHNSLTVLEVKGLFDQARGRLVTDFKELEASLEKGELGLSTILHRVEGMRQAYSRVTRPLIMISRLSVREDFRELSKELEESWAGPLDSLSISQILFRRISELKPANDFEKRLQKVYLDDFKEQGLGHKSPTAPAQMQVLKDKIKGLELVFRSNLQENPPTQVFTELELAGLNANHLEGFEKVDGGYKYNSANSNHLFNILTYASNPETRKLAYQLTRSRAKGNLELMKQILGYRLELAKLKKGQGATWLDVMIDDQTLANNPADVSKVLDIFAKEFKRSTEVRVAQLRELKTKTEKGKDDLKPWDLHFYDRQFNIMATPSGSKSEFSMADIGYFLPAKETIEKVVGQLGLLVGLKIEEDSNSLGYAPGVKNFRVFDRQTGREMGRFILDFNLRNGKNPSSAYVDYYAPPSGDLHGSALPVAITVVNFFNLEDLGRSRFSFNQLRTLVHEMGHNLHALLVKAPSFSLGGFSRSSDFMEIPSILFEQLLREPQFLRSIMTSESGKLPTLSQIKRGLAFEEASFGRGFVRSAPFFSPSYQQNSIFLSILDHQIHGYDEGELELAQLDEVYRSEFAQFHGFATSEEDIFISQFVHPAFGMPGTYYAYLWSRLYVQVLENWFAKNGGIMNPQAMFKYRKAILEASAEKSPLDIIKDLVGKDIDLDGAIQKLL